MIWRAMTLNDLDAVMQVEAGSYSHPWTRGNFTDSVLSGHLAWVLLSDGSTAPPARGKASVTACAEPELLAYLVAMPGVDEMHLLNITVAPACRRQGHAKRLLEQLTAATRERGLGAIWLEVRASNASARRLYQSLGYVEQGVRRAYYPAGHSLREDAVLMSLDLRQPVSADPQAAAPWLGPHAIREAPHAAG
jgi:ribosomal-protein-alanine N-acetyltransferase